MGTRSDVGSMFAIGSIKEDFLGFVARSWSYQLSLTSLQDSLKDYVQQVKAAALT